MASWATASSRPAGVPGGKAGEALRGPPAALGTHPFIHSSTQGFWSPDKWQLQCGHQKRLSKTPSRSWRSCWGRGRRQRMWVMTAPSGQCVGVQWKEQHLTVGGQGRLPGGGDI